MQVVIVPVVTAPRFDRMSPAALEAAVWILGIGLGIAILLLAWMIGWVVRDWWKGRR